MVATICKAFTFHASHQLPNHDGPCRRLHGHTYRLEVFVTGNVRTADGSSEECMVMDFARIKKLYEEIEDLVEHQHLNDSIPMRVPTSENLAHWFWEHFNAHLGDRHALPRRTVAIRLWESPTSYAEVGEIHRCN